jgi:NAD-dependent SIR2 family protein deacetylase
MSAGHGDDAAPDRSLPAVGPIHAGESDGPGAGGENCDFFLVAGSSLVVYPAAGFALAAKRQGAKLAILNRTPADPDDFADLVIRKGIGAILTGVLAAL